MEELNLKSSPLMEVLLKNEKPIVVFQGGTGSAKTYTILIYIIQKALTEWQNQTIDIIRRTFPSLRISVMKDFFDILISAGIYSVNDHNKTENSYKLGSNLVRFYSSDEEQKVRGPRRNVVYFNEVLEFKRMDIIQVMMRTSDFVFMDYNPSEEFHWLYDEVLKRDDVLFHKSTYLDNPFLTNKVIDEIKRLRGIDANLWRIYGLGERGITQATIFTNWEYAEKEYKEFEGQEFYGLDFGFNNPTAMVRVKYHKEGIFIEQLIYKSNLTSDLIVKEIEKLEEEKKLDRTSTIYADNARPEIIEELNNFGFNVQPAKKEKDSVLRGINFLKKHKVFLNKESVDLVKEFRTYKWKVDKDDRVLDVPVDLNDHLCDAARYALSTLSKETGRMMVMEDPENVTGLF